MAIGLLCISGSIVVTGQKISGQSAALISYIDPVSALCFSALFLHEAMTPVQLLGAVLILGGAVFGEIRKQ